VPKEYVGFSIALACPLPSDVRRPNPDEWVRRSQCEAAPPGSGPTKAARGTQAFRTTCTLPPSGRRGNAGGATASGVEQQRVTGQQAAAGEPANRGLAPRRYLCRWAILRAAGKPRLRRRAQRTVSAAGAFPVANSRRRVLAESLLTIAPSGAPRRRRLALAKRPKPATRTATGLAALSRGSAIAVVCRSREA